MKYFLVVVVLLFSFALLLVGQVWAEEFHGYPCTKDCSGHQAGYDWAERRGVEVDADCGGRSKSFIEGCLAWVDQVSARRDDDDDGEENRAAAVISDPSSE